MTRQPGSRGSGATFGLVCGLLLGVLLAMLVVPDRQDTTRVVGPGSGSGPTTGDALSGGDGPAVEGAPGAGSGAAATAGAATAAGGAGTSVGASGDGGSAAPGAGSEPESGSRAMAAAGATARGVTSTKIRIGIAEPDIQALRSLGPRYDQGNVKEQIASVVEGWRRDGKLPVHGRDIELVYRRYQLLVSEDQRAACVNLVQQDKVFAVVAPYVFGVGSECVAREQQTPLVTTDEQLDEVYRRAPLLFSVYPAQGRALRNAAHWAHQDGVLKGKKLGIYYTQRAKQLFDQHFTAQLEKLGYRYTIEQTRARQEGGPEDALAVQRMKAAGVQVVFIANDPAESNPAPSGAGNGFVNQAEAQDFHPQYITFPIQLGTGDTSNSTRNANQWDGAMSMVYLRHGERGAGMTFEPPTEKCLADFERQTGTRIARTGIAPNAEESSLLQVCDTLNLMLEGLANAGPALDNHSLVTGLESIRGMGMASSGPVTLGPGVHAGVAGFRSWRWDSSCPCGKVVGNPAWRPFVVP